MSAQGVESEKTALSTWFVFWMLTFGLLFIIVAVLAARPILSRYDIATFRGYSLDFWKVWEVASILVTTVITLVFWTTYFISNSAVFKGVTRPGYAVFAALLLGAFAACFISAGIFAFRELPVVGQILLLVVGVVCTNIVNILALKSTHAALESCDTEFAAIDEIAGIDNDGIKIKMGLPHALGVRDALDAREGITKYLCFSDMPICVAMIVLATFVMFWARGDADPHDVREMRAFIGGAVALQLLYSNLVYWVEAFADIPQGRRFFDSLPKPFKSIKLMLLGDGDWPTEPADRIQWAKHQLSKHLS